MPGGRPTALGLVDWGTLDYPTALGRMRDLRAARARGEVPDTLILVEHPTVLTVGVEGSDGESLPEGVPIVRVERGGKGTLHNPGQLVGYPIVDLEARGRDVRRFVHDVEEMVARSLAEFGLAAQRVPGRRGVWIDGTRKIASVGIAVERWVTFHGFALNVSNDLRLFEAFHPCGLPGSAMTSVSRELGREVPTSDMRTRVARAWHTVFGPLGAADGSAPRSTERARSPMPAT